jgi:hypothetical protein
MSTEEFYGQALLAAFPIAVRESNFDKARQKAESCALAHEYAAELTQVFKKNRGSFE